MQIYYVSFQVMHITILETCRRYCHLQIKIHFFHISPSGATDSLTVNWTPGGGDVDSYVVSAFRQNQMVESQTVLKHVSEHTFQRLEAGEQYRIVIASVSGSQKNQIDALGRTSRCPPGKGPDSSPGPFTNGQYPNSQNLYCSMWFQELFSYFFLCIFLFQ